MESGFQLGDIGRELPESVMSFHPGSTTVSEAGTPISSAAGAGIGARGGWQVARHADRCLATLERAFLLLKFWQKSFKAPLTTSQKRVTIGLRARPIQGLRYSNQPACFC